MFIARTILLFFTYAFLGWCCEVAFAAIKEGRFVNRGFLNGPVCPIYGFGVIGVVLALRPVQDDLPMLYVGSVVLTSAIEFVTGWALEKLFHARWWDYSNMPMNIMGYVCILFSMVWGVACMAIVLWVHPLFETGVVLLPDWLCVLLDAVFGAVFAFDLCATVVAVRKLSDRLTRLTEAASELHSISDEIGQTIFDTTQTVLGGAEAVRTRGAGAKEQLETLQGRVAAWFAAHRAQANARTEALRERFESARARFTRAIEEKGFGHRRLLNAFPNLTSHRNQEALEALRAFYEKHRLGRK